MRQRQPLLSGCFFFLLFLGVVPISTYLSTHPSIHLRYNSYEISSFDTLGSLYTRYGLVCVFVCVCGRVGIDTPVFLFERRLGNR